MAIYKAPLRDMRFLMHEVFDYVPALRAIPAHADLDRNLIDQILEEAAKFAENELLSLNRSGDEEGCTLKDGKVTTPRGFAAAYRAYCDGGWPATTCDPAYGGQGLPKSLGLAISEMATSANLAWAMYPGLSHGAYEALHSHGSESLKATYLPNLVQGRWTGTMCLTEPQCGTDLGLLRTRAEPQADGSYRLTGTKIFISAGEHDMAENILHLVLARLPNAPKGVKGISLFLAPKYLVDDDGSLGRRNPIFCGALEHKMGIKANATAVLNLDGASGWMIGAPNKGLSCMFTMMNAARLGVAIQGVSQAEVAFQSSLAYARERLQMRSLKGAKAPDREADPIIVHPDVRRMLLTQKAYVEGGRALTVWLGLLLDERATHPDEERRKAADELVALLTPVAKAFLTDNGFQCCVHGQQVFGGHGYIREWGMEQLVRDVRITQIYEGTNGIQALDLLGRKILQDRGAALRKLLKLIGAFCGDAKRNSGMKEFVTPVLQLADDLGEIALGLGGKALLNADVVGAAAAPYLRLMGHLVLGFCWARIAAIALAAKGPEERAFYEAKLATARFYFGHLFPETLALKQVIKAGQEDLMEIKDEHFIF